MRVGSVRKEAFGEFVQSRRPQTPRSRKSCPREASLVPLLLLVLPRPAAAVRGVGAVRSDGQHSLEDYQEDPHNSCCGICTSEHSEAWFNGTPSFAIMQDSTAWTALQDWPHGSDEFERKASAGKAARLPGPEANRAEMEKLLRPTAEAWMKAWSKTGSSPGYELRLLSMEVVLALAIIGLYAVCYCRRTRQE
mmetsp:Transcript_39747/g.73649  ORF Transcript_39747/g.73649 Transcript_39747/m.73649 type:complete len:193 (-) Transcript_39747:162-740(-)